MSKYVDEAERAELVQSAAVIVASLEDGIFGNGAQGGTFTAAVAEAIRMERLKQNAKWGPQAHTREEWAMILAEEIGEWAEEAMLTATGDAWEALRKIRDAGNVDARAWLENHEWPEREQAVYNEEAASGKGN